MDSVQFEEFPCTTTTQGYDSPNILGSVRQGSGSADDYLAYYNRYYRIDRDEAFALAVLLFKVLMNDANPYSLDDNGQTGIERLELVNALCVNGTFAYGEEISETKLTAHEK
jgi:hypothetical protein